MSDVTDVVVVGAGAAGISAMRVLVRSSHTSLLLEASPRIGGRAWTVTPKSGISVDLGGEWLHSADQNHPWVRIAQTTGAAIDCREAAWGKQYNDLDFTPEEQEEARRLLRAWNSEMRHRSPRSDNALDAALQIRGAEHWRPYLERVVSALSGKHLTNVSVADYMSYLDASTRVDWRLPGGFGNLVAASLPRGATTQLATPVTAIVLEPGGVRLETWSGSVRARAVIITVPTNVLASGAITLPSELTSWRDAAADLSLGSNEKVFLEVLSPADFEPETQVVGKPRSSLTGAYYIRPLSMNIIEGFYGGEAASQVSSQGAAFAYDFAVEELTCLFGSNVRSVLRPLAMSGWGLDPWIRGSYSCASPGKSDARVALARPFDSRVFFAGEATHRTEFSTMHGAFRSGERAAREALDALAI